MTSCFAYKVIRDLESIDDLCINPILSIDDLCINPIHRIGLIHKSSIDSRKLKWTVQVNVLLNNCKQKHRHCHSWLAGQYIQYVLLGAT